MLKISVFYLIKQKSFIPKKYDLGRSQYQNKKALFTDPIFNDGFTFMNLYQCVLKALFFCVSNMEK